MVSQHMHMTITTITLKGTIQDSLQPPHCTVNCLQHVCTRGHGTVCANLLQQTGCLSCATCVQCGMNRQLSCQVWQTLNHIYFGCISLAETITPGITMRHNIFCHTVWLCSVICVCHADQDSGIRYTLIREITFCAGGKQQFADIAKTVDKCKT